MVYSERLRDLLVDPNLEKLDKVLLILYENNKKPKTPSEVVKTANANGFRDKALQNNASRILNSYSPKTVRTERGWEITPQGIDYLINKGLIQNSPIEKQQSVLRGYLEKIYQEDVKHFLEEAITALERKLYRSSIVLSWVGALAILQEHVFKHHLKNYNQEMARRFPKQKPVKTQEDFSVIQEYDFLQICNLISVFGKNTKHELEQCLKRRNACGHPNKLIVGEHMVASHLEFLILNVFSKYI